LFGILHKREFALTTLKCAAAVVLLLVLPSAAVAADTVGKVSRVQYQAQIGGAAAVVGMPVHMNDRLMTGPKARLEITFRDQTRLTLGENASIVVDRYVFNPGEGTGEMTVNATRGAMRFVTGKIGKLPNHNVTVVTPNAALAVRGTDFWVGPINGEYGVLLMKGNVGVSGRPKRRTKR
jgi:hypothetical protein